MYGMSSPRTLTSSSSVSHNSIAPNSRSPSPSSLVSSLSLERRIEGEADSEPFLPINQKDHQGMMSGRPNANSSRRVSQGPAPVALPRRNSATKMIHDWQDWFAKGPIIGNDKYDTVEALVEGGEGQCFVKKSKSTGNLFVVKHTKPVKLRDIQDREYPDTTTHRFPNEARILGRTLKAQRNLVQMLQILPDNIEPGRFYLWMEYCSGGDLITQVFHWWYKKKSPVPEQFLLHVIISLADALAFIHHGLRSRDDGKYREDEFHDPVIHADIKGENVFLRWSDKTIGGMPEIVLGDFGIAKRAEQTNAKLNAGTLAYMAPEDVAIHQNVPMSSEYEETWLKVVNSRTTAMDIYSFGQVIYQIAAREPEPREIGLNPTDLRIFREYDTPDIREVIVKCLAIDPTQRAQASFHESLGILPDVTCLRTARNTMVDRRMKLDRMEWARPAPRG